MKSRTQASHGSRKESWRSVFAFLSVLVVIAASVALSSCAGYTSASAPGGGQAGDPGAGVLSPGSTSVSFGNVAVGSTATQTVSVTNTGTATVNISGATITGAGFTMVSGSGATSVPVGQSASVQVQFAPTSDTNYAGTLTVTSNASNSTLTISLSGTGTEAIVALSPASLNFNDVPVGQTSSQNVTITNNGNSNLTFSSATISGTGFTMSGLNPLPTIAGGQSATFSVQFTPTSTAGATGNVVLRDNAGNSPQTLTMTGSAIAAGSTLTPNPGSVNFGNVVVGSSSPQTITLSNTGNSTITISQVTTTGSGFSASGISAGQTIAAGGTASLTTAFAPTATGTVSGNISITSTATDATISIPLSGTGTQGALTANPASISFGNLPVGDTASVAVTLTNGGTAAVSITGSSVTGTGFSMSTLSPQTLNPTQTASFNVTFAPTAAGSVSGSVSITTNGPGSPLKINLSGTGTQPQISANPASVNFGTVTVGNSNSQPVTLTNNGNATLTFSQITVAGTGFSQTGLSTSTTIAAGGSTSFNAVFTPSSATAVNGSITLTTNGAPSPLVISLSGTGATPTLSLGTSPASLPFGNVGDGTSSVLTTTLTNNGNSNITISNVAVTGAGFSASGVSNGTVLTPGQSATLSVTFAPTAAGAVSGAGVTITSNATNSPTTVTLSGTGTHSVLLQWQASSTSGVQYNVFRGTSSGGEGTSPINSTPVSTTSFTDTKVTSGQTYFYTVEAVNSGGSSTPSNEVQISLP
ncbi:MAG TPA: choice-of-anchor D domain-containing protein [Candidatus Acidoferrum sp.]|nr:choice-of-anchor D domain-containing protein [Candidatus Acidoferrum sp.]